MFEEMGEAALVFGFGEAADVEAHTDDDAVLGRAVFEQRIFHPVREHAEDDVRVDRNVARRETPCLCRLALRVGGGGCRLRRCFLRIGRGGTGDEQDEGRQRGGGAPRSEEHTSELRSLMRISYAVFCLKKKTKNT